jgi:hypothetical protein
MFCSHCGKEIADNQAVCHHCGKAMSTPIPPPIYVHQPQKSGCGKMLGIGFLAFIGLGMLGAIISGTQQNNQPEKSALSSQNDKQPENTATPVPGGSSTPTPQTAVPTAAPSSKFDGDCGIAASAHLKSDQFINHPHLRISVSNIADKNIAAIQFLAVPYDVYGRDISSSLFSLERLRTDDLIPVGKSEELHYGPFLDQKMKSVKLYVYSVYFEDGTEWGDKDASRSEILKYAKPIEATFEK